jgi:hypothetical protein
VQDAGVGDKAKSQCGQGPAAAAASSRNSLLRIAPGRRQIEGADQDVVARSSKRRLTRKQQSRIEDAMPGAPARSDDLPRGRAPGAVTHCDQDPARRGRALDLAVDLRRRRGARLPGRRAASGPSRAPGGLADACGPEVGPAPPASSRRGSAPAPRRGGAGERRGSRPGCAEKTEGAEVSLGCARRKASSSANSRFPSPG